MATGSAASFLASAALPILLRFPPEAAHGLALRALHLTRRLWPARKVGASLEVDTFGQRFSHPVGLAAGFDKNGDYLDALGALGFSHIEVGTVTPRPQAGNPAPRLFRVRGQRALINRMGFNNKGADYVARRLRAAVGGFWPTNSCSSCRWRRAWGWWTPRIGPRLKVPCSKQEGGHDR